MVPEGLGEALGLPRVLEDSADLSQGRQRLAQLEAQIDGLLEHVPGLRKMGHGRQRLLPAGHGLSEGAAGHRLGGGPLKIVKGLPPGFPSHGVVGQPLELLVQSVGVEHLDSLYDSRMQGAAPLLQEAAVGDLMGQGVFEGEFEFGKQAALVEELGRLQVREPPADILLGVLGDGQEQGEGRVLADDGGSLEEALLLGGESIDAGGQDCLHRRWHLDAGKGLGQAVGAPLPGQHLCLHQRPDALLEKEGVPLGATDQKLLEGP